MAEPEFTIEELANEEWRDVVGYEGIYSISNLGRVRRDLARNATPGKILKLGKKARGYFSVSLSINDKRRSHAVHKLVAAAFFGECPPGKQVNHKYPPKTNNRVDNLEYLTQRENIQHSIRTGLAPTGGNIGTASNLATAGATSAPTAGTAGTGGGSPTTTTRRRSSGCVGNAWWVRP
jgi:hypothetical protein